MEDLTKNINFDINEYDSYVNNVLNTQEILSKNLERLNSLLLSTTTKTNTAMILSNDIKLYNNKLLNSKEKVHQIKLKIDIINKRLNKIKLLIKDKNILKDINECNKLHHNNPYIYNSNKNINKDEAKLNNIDQSKIQNILTTLDII